MPTIQGYPYTINLCQRCSTYPCRCLPLAPPTTYGEHSMFQALRRIELLLEKIERRLPAD